MRLRRGVSHSVVSASQPTSLQVLRTATPHPSAAQRHRSTCQQLSQAAVCQALSEGSTGPLAGLGLTRSRPPSRGRRTFPIPWRGFLKIIQQGLQAHVARRPASLLLLSLTPVNLCASSSLPGTRSSPLSALLISTKQPKKLEKAQKPVPSSTRSLKAPSHSHLPTNVRSAHAAHSHSSDSPTCD